MGADTHHSCNLEQGIWVWVGLSWDPPHGEGRLGGPEARGAIIGELMLFPSQRGEA